MPRRRDPDDEDMEVTCPQCRGTGTIYRFDLETEDECPLCTGTGRVPPHVRDKYLLR